MKLLKKVSLTAALLSAITTALAHPGHEAIGDLLHVEYLFAADLLVAALGTAKAPVTKHNLSRSDFVSVQRIHLEPIASLQGSS